MRFSLDESNRSSTERDATESTKTSGEADLYGHNTRCGLGLDHKRSPTTVTVLILLLGCAASAAFLTIGILSALGDSEKAFETDVEQLAIRVHNAFREYENAALWVHQFSYSHKNNSAFSQTQTHIPFPSNFRSLFRSLYDAVVAKGLPLHAIQFIPNITRDDRALYEVEAQEFYRQYYPQVAARYTGFSGFVPDDSAPAGVSLKARDPDDFYFPVHFVEPVLDNLGVIDFDVYSEDYPRWAVNTALETMQPVITGRLRLIQEPDPSPDAFSVLMMHPGIKSVKTNIYDDERTPSGDVSLVAVRIPSLLNYIATQKHRYGNLKDQMPTMDTYLYDSTPDDPTLEKPSFLGGVRIFQSDVDQDLVELEYLPQTNLEALELGRAFYQTKLEIGLRQWTLACVAVDGPYPPDVTFAVVGGSMILFAFSCLSLWVWTEMNRTAQTAQLKAKAQEEQALLRIDHARQAAAAERQLNEFIAHEVRNPLSAAMSACSFVLSAIQDENGLFGTPKCTSTNSPNEAPKSLFALSNAQSAHPTKELAPSALFPMMAGTPNRTEEQPGAKKTIPLFQVSSSVLTKPAMPAVAPQQQQPQESREEVLEDLHIIDSSLQFINDLLRNMLDVQRAACHQLKVEKGPTDILRDVLEPVDAMLYRRGRNSVKVIIDCPDPHLLVETDRLRLKQVVLNLARNASKFVDKGWIKFRVVVVPVQGSEHQTINTGPVDGEPKTSVQIWIEDTGVGIPAEKKAKLFAKFQDSLDNLSQGTGLGLSLCKILVRLMGGTIWLDDSYHSGFDDRPGSRFIIDLNTPPMCDTYEENGEEDKGTRAMADDAVEAAPPPPLEKGTADSTEASLVDSDSLEVDQMSRGYSTGASCSYGSISSLRSNSLPVNVQVLPKELSVLFVDDDTVLRKLLMRAVRALAPGWALYEAASGEAALRLADENQYDLIFMDQYMASMQKQLLGTETTQALRAKGVGSKICGLSANEMADDFFAAGANAFVCKPLPTKKDALRQILCDIMFAEVPEMEGAVSQQQSSQVIISPYNHYS